MTPRAAAVAAACLARLACRCRRRLLAQLQADGLQRAQALAQGRCAPAALLRLLLRRRQAGVQVGVLRRQRARGVGEVQQSPLLAALPLLQLCHCRGVALRLPRVAALRRAPQRRGLALGTLGLAGQSLQVATQPRVFVGQGRGARAKAGRGGCCQLTRGCSALRLVPGLPCRAACWCGGGESTGWLASVRAAQAAVEERRGAAAAAAAERLTCQR